MLFFFAALSLLSPPPAAPPPPAALWRATESSLPLPFCTCVEVDGWNLKERTEKSAVRHIHIRWLCTTVMFTPIHPSYYNGQVRRSCSLHGWYSLSWCTYVANAFRVAVTRSADLADRRPTQRHCPINSGLYIPLSYLHGDRFSLRAPFRYLAAG